MHCLFVSSLLPGAKPGTGFEIANQAIVEAYEGAGVRLTKAGFRRPGGPPPSDGEMHLGDLAIENAGASRLTRVGWVARALAHRLPVSGAKLRVLPEGELLARLSAAGPFDAVILNSVQMPTAYPGLLSLAPAIFVAHNVEHVSALQNASSAKNSAERLLFRREARLLRRIETDLCRKAAAVHVLAAEDAPALGLGNDPRCLPLPLSLGRRPRVDDGRRTHDVGLIGTWSWAPNRVGLDWFLREVAPRLGSGIGVAVAGLIDGPPPPAPAHVRFLGRVPDAQSFVGGSRVLALATTAGTGVQLKTLETLEEGMPAVATRLALRGIDAGLPANVTLADEPQAFADALTRMVHAERAGGLVRGSGGDFAALRQARARQAARGALALAQAKGHSAR